MSQECPLYAIYYRRYLTSVISIVISIFDVCFINPKGQVKRVTSPTVDQFCMAGNSSRALPSTYHFVRKSDAQAAAMLRKCPVNFDAEQLILELPRIGIICDLIHEFGHLDSLRRAANAVLHEEFLCGINHMVVSDEHSDTQMDIMKVSGRLHIHIVLELN
jgi:hypothetical protein